MKKIALMFVLSIAFLSCEKTLPDVPDDEIPAWLKTRISQDEQTIQDYPKYMASWGAWIRYKWQKEYYFEYHNILSSSSVAPISENGDTLYYGATNMKYYNEKCCKQYVWKAPNYKEY
jgi:hypothetical protein